MKTILIVICSLVSVSALAGIAAPTPAAGGFGVASIMAITALLTTVGYRVSQSNEEDEDV